jgi:hypothetical protein
MSGADPEQAKSANEKGRNATHLRVEGLACFVGLSPQVMDRGLLLLEGLAQVLVRDAELHQLPVQPRDIVFPLLKGCLRPLERGALLLEPTLHLFPR